MTIPKAIVTAAAGVIAAPVPAPAITKTRPAIHDAAQQARNLRQVLQDDKQRIGWAVSNPKRNTCLAISEGLRIEHGRARA